VHVRLVKGAYVEASGAHPYGDDTDVAYLRLGLRLADGYPRRSVFWVNVPIVATAIVCTARFVPESQAARTRRFDPVGQSLATLVLGSMVFAVIESDGPAGSRQRSRTKRSA